jgi:tetratricopeptide repeat protein 30
LGYCKYEYYAYAGDLLAENTELAIKTMSQREAYGKFEGLCKAKADILRRLMRHSEDEHMQNQLSLEFEATIGELVPLLMCQEKIFWDLGNYQLVELLLMKYLDVCMENRTRKLNLAHA